MRLATILFLLATSFGWAQAQFAQGNILVGPHLLHVQLATTEAAREQGLMKRQTLAPYAGMLFIFPEPRAVSFWMKDTLLPLQIGYFDSQGILREIYSMKPLDTTCHNSRRSDILYALELPAGDFERLGLTIGQKLRLGTPFASDKLDNPKSMLK